LAHLSYSTHNRHQATLQSLLNFAVERQYLKANPLTRRKRWCFYGKETAAILEKYGKYYRHEGHPALFTARQPLTGEISRLGYRTAHRDWRYLIGKSLLLAGCRLHDLRHTFATERVGLMGIEELRALMGHENIQTTLRYQKVTSARAEVVAKKALAAIDSSDST
jgi:integrase/recombinase XerD